jgi:hypothetical protein
MSADFDKAIDRAVREMLDVEPPDDLRERVVRQIDGTRGRGGSRTAPPLRWIGISVAAAAMVLAVFVARRSESVPQAPVVAHGVDRHLPAAIVEAPAAPTRVHAPAAPRLAAAARPPGTTPPERGSVAAASVDGDASADVAIDPLTSIAPIAVAAIAQDSIAPAQIAVRPLNRISDLQIAPLTPPDRRN